MRSQFINIQNKFPKISRISWGAILAGAITAVVVAFLLNLLGLGIGLTTIDPMTEAKPLDGLGTGTLIWWGISNLAALFIGGMVAGRMCGLPMNSDGGLHGFLAWALYLILSLYLVSSTVGGIFNGFERTASAIFSNSDAEKIAQAIKDAETQGRDNTSISIDQIKRQAFELLNKAERVDILPNDTSTEVRQAINEVESDSQKFLKDLNVDEKIDEFVNDISVELDNNGNLKIQADGTKDILNKQQIKKYLAENTDLTRAEIEGVITKWDRKISTAVSKAELNYQKVKRKATKAADETADAVGTFSIIIFFLLLIGAGAAFAGGAVGSPFHTVEEEHIENNR